MLTDQKISAGSYDLNKWLYGGYEKDIITTIYGPAGSGKTNFCLIAASSLAKKGKKVIYIDTEGGFSVERVRQIAGENCKEVLDNVLLFKPTTFLEQQDAFLQLLKELKKGEVGLVIIDGMTMLYRLEIAEAKQKDDGRVKLINSELAKQMRILAEIARKQEIAVIATNQVYSEFLSEEDLKNGKERRMMMVGGDILKYWSKCIIELEYNRGKRRAILRKHRSMPEKDFNFEITNEGVRRRGWI